MESIEQTPISIETSIKAPIEKVWEFWNTPAHIKQWCNASNEWHAPFAENNLQVNGKFKTTMAAKDGSMSFDFEGIYTNIQEFQTIEYTLSDARKVKIVFATAGDTTNVTETFDPEDMNSIEIQKSGWQAILDNFKKYTENN